MSILRTCNYKIHAPTVLDFVKMYVQDVLGIKIINRQETKKKEEFAFRVSGKGAEITNPEADSEHPSSPPTFEDIEK